MTQEKAMDDFAPSLPSQGEAICYFDFGYQLVGGKRRYIGRPNRGMKRFHRQLTELLHSIIERTDRLSFESATASLPGCMVMFNAARHAQSRYFYNFDVRNAYPSVDTLWMAGALFGLEPRLGSLDEIMYFLERYCIAPRGGLITGAPASPALFNIYCAAWIDRKIRALCEPEGLVYTRYMDDCTISSQKPISADFRRNVRNVVTRAGLQIHHRKSYVEDLERGPVEITGVRLWSNGRRSPTSEFVGKLRWALRKPLSQMSKKELQVFAGLAAHLMTFLPHYATAEVPRLQRQVKARLKEMSSYAGYVRSVEKRKERVPMERRSFSFAGIPGAYLDEMRTKLAGEGVLEAIIGKKVELKKPIGKNKERFGRCPFHTEKTASFSVTEKKGFFHCFGCGEHGDAIQFVMKTEGLSFPEAVRLIARWLNMPPRPL